MARGTCIIRFLFFLSVSGMFAKVKADTTDTESADTTDTESAQETPPVRRWRQFNYTGMESIDKTSLENVFHPVILTSEVQGESVKIKMMYHERIMSTPFWEFKFDGVSYTTTQGLVVRDGSQISTSIDFPVFWNNNQFLAFSISSDIGIYYIELDYDLLLRIGVDMSVPRTGMKMAVPKTFDGYAFPVTVERSGKEVQNSCFEFFRGSALLRCVDDASGKVERLPALGVYTKEESKRRVVNEYGIFDDYHNRESEVVVSSICTDHVRPWGTYGVFKDTKLVKYTSRNSADVADSVNITFVDGIYGAQDVLNFDETFPYRSVSCEAFGYPKPVVSIEHEAGRSLPTVELKQSSGMSTHVTASLDDVSLNEAVGKYICTATAGSKTVSKTIEVKKVIRPEILVAEVFINNTEEIIAVCIARGQPAPKISFTVNYAKKDKIEKRPVLETERTVKRTHVSKYKTQGGLSVDSWFESKAERCPKPDSITMKKSLHDSDVTKRMIAIKPLPYLSRQRVDLLYCRAEGFDNVFVTKEVTANISLNIRRFMTHVNSLSFLSIFG